MSFCRWVFAGFAMSFLSLLKANDNGDNVKRAP